MKVATVSQEPIGGLLTFLQKDYDAVKGKTPTRDLERVALSDKNKIELLVESMAPVLEKVPGIVVIHTIKSPGVVYMNKAGLLRFNISLQELQDLGDEHFDIFLEGGGASEYILKVLYHLECRAAGELVSCFKQLEHKGQDNLQWHICGTSVLMVDEDEEPMLTITIAIPIDSRHYYSSKIKRLHEENSLLRSNYDVFATLTKREKEILCLMAQDKTSTEIGSLLFISDDTVKTHRRNIKRKINALNHYDVVRFAQAFDLV